MGRRRIGPYRPFVRVQNPRQGTDSARAWVRAGVVLVVTGLAATAFASPTLAQADSSCVPVGAVACR